MDERKLCDLTYKISGLNCHILMMRILAVSNTVINYVMPVGIRFTYIVFEFCVRRLIGQRFSFNNSQDFAAIVPFLGGGKKDIVTVVESDFC